MTVTDDYVDQALLDLELEAQLEAEPAVEEEEEVVLNPEGADFVKDLSDRILMFCEELAGVPLHPYQREFGYRIIESLVLNDGEEITALWARQSGKTQTVSLVLSGCMVILPKLAPMFPQWLEKFERGLMVGIFAPVDEQAETLHGRIVDWLTSDRAVEIMLDPEIDDSAAGKGTIIRLKKSGSFCRQQTANPRAKIESKSYHVVVIDECQEADSYVVNKSIRPMLAYYNGTIIHTGTPSRTKGVFYKAIQHNKRRMTKRGARQNHFEFNWRYVAKYNPNYAKFIKKEIQRLGADSEEFLLSYELKWLLDRGMFVT
jgi:phage terminase large subunit-like protein